MHSPNTVSLVGRTTIGSVFGKPAADPGDEGVFWGHTDF
jgi:hypothetical protein